MSKRGERRFVTVMFADISGFSELAQRLDPEDLRLLIDDCFSELSQTIYKYEGYIDKIIGDCLMVLFGAPVAHEDDALRAVITAIELQAGIKKFSKSRKQNLSLSIGINYGLVVTGGITLESRYTVMGDTVNLAERLQGSAPASEIYVGESVYNRTHREIEYREVGPILVKGRQTPVQAYIPLKIKSKTLVRRVKEAFLVGREKELKLLCDRLDRAKDSNGQLISIIGEAGIGKSKLLYEFKSMLKPDESGGSHLPIGEGMIKVSDVIWLEGRSIEYLSDSPYWAVNELLHELFQINEQDSKAIMVEKVESFISKRGLGFTAPFIKYLLSLDVGDEQRARFNSMKAEARKMLIEENLINFLIGVAKYKPIVLVFDDAHWIDPATYDFVVKLANLVASYPIMIILLYRPGLRQFALKSCQIKINELTQEETVKLACRVFNCSKMDRELESLLVRRSEGNPLYAEELSLTLMSNNMIIVEDNTVRLKSHEVEAMSESLSDLIMARMDKLTDEPKNIVKLASVVGNEFNVNILERLIPMNWDSTLRNALDIIEEFDLIYKTTNIDYRFKHIITRDTIYNSILKSERATYHCKVGETMEELYKESIDEYLDSLAHHFMEGSMTEKAFNYLRKSAQRKKELYLVDEAIAEYKECIKLKEEVSLYEDLGALYELKGEYENAIAAYESMSKVEPENELIRARSKRLMAKVMLRQSRYEEVHNLLEEAESTLQNLKNNLEEANIELSLTLAERSWVYRTQGEIKLAHKLSNRALELLDEIKLNDTNKFARLQAQVFNNFATILGDQHQYDLALNYFERILSIYERLGDKQGVGAAYSNIGNIYYERYNYEKAIILFKKSVSIYEEIGNKPGISDSLSNIALIYRKRANYNKAIELLKKILVIYEELGDKSGIAIAAGSLGAVYYELGNYAEATKFFSKALKIYEKANNKAGVGITSLNLGGVYYEQADYEKAGEFFNKALRISESLKDKDGIAGACCNLGTVYYELANYKKAIELLEKSLKISEEIKDEETTGIVLLYLGRTYEEIADYAKAKKYLTDSEETFKKIENKSYLIETLNESAELTLRRGNNLELAESNVKEALRIARLTKSKADKASSLTMMGKLYHAKYVKSNNRNTGIAGIRHFEKAIEIFKELKQISMLGTAHLEYGKLLKTMGSADAKTQLELAKSLYTKLNLQHKVKEAESELNY